MTNNGRGDPRDKGRCTWEGCSEQAVENLVNQSGEVWARLCRKHKSLLDMVVEQVKNEEGHGRKLIAAWIKAQGGAVKAARRTTESIRRRTE